MADDTAYFLGRAKKERELAILSEDNAVALAHLKMAEEYERRAKALASLITVSDSA